MIKRCTSILYGTLSCHLINCMASFAESGAYRHQTTGLCRRHHDVEGDHGKRNDVIICGDTRSAREHVVFFGGDTQDYPEVMMTHPINMEYVHWNLERVAELLHNRFPGSAVFVIKPSRMHLRTFSVYSNFVECNAFGAPTHESNGGSWNHLHKLYQSALIYSTEKGKCVKETGSQDQPIVNDLNTVAMTKQDGDKSNDFIGSCKTHMPQIKIIGFSKGCIVLNQLLYDLEEIDANESLKNWVQQISAFYWLDGGHPGGSNTWVTDSAILERFSKLKLQIFVHVTPYQVRDEMRKWIGQEEQKFVEKLKKLDAQVQETLHFENELRSIDNHFKVLLHY